MLAAPAPRESDAVFWMKGISLMCTPSILHICNLKIFEDIFEKTTGIGNLEGEGKGKGGRNGRRDFFNTVLLSETKQRATKKAPGHPE